MTILLRASYGTFTRTRAILTSSTLKHLHKHYYFHRNTSSTFLNSVAYHSACTIRVLPNTTTTLTNPSHPSSHYHPKNNSHTHNNHNTNNKMRCPFPLFLSFAAAFTIRSHTSVSEAAVFPTKTTTSEDDQEKHCPFYGCPLLPEDVHYNTDGVKEALTKLRAQVKTNSTQDKEKKTIPEQVLQTAGNEQSVTLTLIGYKGGSLEEQINQDRAIVISPFRFVNNATKNDKKKKKKKDRNDNDEEHNNVLLGVFDGHAQLGEIVSEYTKNELPSLLSTKLSEIYNNDNNNNKKNNQKTEEEIVEQTKQVLIDTFIELDKTAPAEISGGCTATIVLKVGGGTSSSSKVYFANAGDSRSFLVTYRPLTNKAKVVYITREDKPNLDDERARVEAAGGTVMVPERGTSRVVYLDPRTGTRSGLAMSRSIGDWEAGKVGVIPDPLVDVIDIPTLVQAELMQSTTTYNNSTNTTTNATTNGETTTTTVVIDDKGTIQDEERQLQQQPPEKVIDDVHIFAVSATDGMMDYLTSEDIAAYLATALYHPDGLHPISAAEQLIFAAANGWQQSKMGRYRDDIAIAFSTLRRPPPPSL